MNSVTGEEASLASVLALVKEHACAVIGLCDVIIDPLATDIGAGNKAALITLEAIRLIRTSFGVNITYWGSNVLFSLSERSLINASFLSMAVALGVTCPIVDPPGVEIRKVVAACALLLGRDEYAMRFLQHSRSGW